MRGVLTGGMELGNVLLLWHAVRWMFQMRRNVSRGKGDAGADGVVV